MTDDELRDEVHQIVGTELTWKVDSIAVGDLRHIIDRTTDKVMTVFARSKQPATLDQQSLSSSPCTTCGHQRGNGGCGVAHNIVPLTCYLWIPRRQTTRVTSSEGQNDEKT